jgi:hypothetical protein
MDLVVRITCDENVAGDACRNTPVGGTFERTATIVMTTPRSSGTTIRFTLDGSEPTEASEAYRGPLIISNTTRIAAKAFLSEDGPRAEGTSYPQLVTRPVFRLAHDQALRGAAGRASGGGGVGESLFVF